MTVELTKEQGIKEIVRTAVQSHGASSDELIPILMDVNRTMGYLSSSALDEMCLLLKIPKSQIFSIASFYHMLSTTPRGKHVIQFCESAPCHVVGGAQVWQKLREASHLEAGETSQDGKWSLITTSCLGICGVGPVIVIDGDIFGNVQPDEVASILARYD